MEILNSLGDLRKIGNASLNELASFKGVGNAKAAQVMAAFELGKRALAEAHEKGPVFSSGRDVYIYYR
jgi:DNA repair protein RadC